VTKGLLRVHRCHHLPEGKRHAGRLRACAARADAVGDGPSVPFGGKPSNPGYIPAIVKKMAELHRVDDATAFRTVWQNCRDLYGF
jgi:hypothetical protein